MTDNPWYSFYVGDYSRKTAHLSLLEHGAYRLLLDHYYATRSPLPNDIVKLSRICRARSPSERKAVLSVVAEFFIEDGTLLRHERCDSEVSKLLKYSDSQSAKAKQRHCKAPATAKPRVRVSQPQPQSSVSKDTSLTPTPLPEWLPSSEWEAFKEMRNNMKPKLTAKAEELAIKELAKLRDSGHDPTLVLEQSLRNSWKDVYQLKQKGNHNENASRNTVGSDATTSKHGGVNIGKSKWTSAAEQIIAEDRAKRAAEKLGH